MINLKNQLSIIRRLHLDLIPLVCMLLMALACSSGEVGPTGPSFPSEAQVEAASFDLINQDRRQHGLPELTMNLQIATVARAHSADMRDRNYFAHVDPEGKTLDDRLKTAGIGFHRAGENLAHITDISDPASFANTIFLNDTQHRAILLNRQFTRVGVGVVRSGNTYWITQDFIKR